MAEIRFLLAFFRSAVKSLLMVLYAWLVMGSLKVTVMICGVWLISKPPGGAVLGARQSGSLHAGCGMGVLRVGGDVHSGIE